MRRSVKKIQLPQNFAQQILQNEIQLKLSDSADKQTIKNLIELFTLGVEYYESIRSHKYLYFQMKLNELFMNPSTVSSLEEKEKVEDQESPLKKKMNSQVQQEKIEALKIKQKQEKMMSYVKEKTNEANTTHQVKSLLNENVVKQIQMNQKVKKEINEQEKKFHEKLSKRKSKYLFSKSSSMEGIEGTQTRSSLFVDPSTTSFEPSNVSSAIKPIEVTFEKIINENENEGEQQKGK